MKNVSAQIRKRVTDIDATFDEIDRDGSGTLEFNEILRAVFPLATEAEFVQMMSWVRT